MKRPERSEDIDEISPHEIIRHFDAEHGLILLPTHEFFHQQWREHTEETLKRKGENRNRSK